MARVPGARDRSCPRGLQVPAAGVRAGGRALSGCRSDVPHRHSSRSPHTAASLAISAGANAKAVQTMLGHDSATLTLDTYADLFADDVDAVEAHMDVAAQCAGVGIVGTVWARA
jgi:integrase